jgi:hypothetical protein
LWVRIPLMVRCTQYNIMRLSLSVTCNRLVVFSGYSGFHIEHMQYLDLSDVMTV